MSTAAKSDTIFLCLSNTCACDHFIPATFPARESKLCVHAVKQLVTSDLYIVRCSSRAAQAEALYGKGFDK